MAAERAAVEAFSGRLRALRSPRVACAAAKSANWHSALMRRICSTVLQRAVNSAGDATMIARHCARDTATLSRFLLKRKSMPRGTSSPVELVIENRTIGASWPWNLSTVPIRAPSGSAARRQRTCAL